MNLILWLYLLGVVIVAVGMTTSTEVYRPELIIFCSIFYPIVLLLGLMTLVLVGILAFISVIAEALETATGGIKNGK